MTDAVLLDTHIALWLESGSDRLRPETLGLIEACWRGGGTVLISASTVWEIAQLVHYRRIALDRPLDDWIERFANRPGVEVLPLGYRAALGAYRLDPLEHRDPADRLLIATAIEQGCPLITYDPRIIRFGELHGHRHGFTARA
nr:type II toxin-antitoxin system VapC family toxin [uncultured Rhodopila sp.]